MRSSFNVPRLLVIALLLVVPSAAAAGGLDAFLDSVEVRAGADLGSFKADLSVTFGVSDAKVDGLFSVMSRPSDVYMCLRVGEVADQPVDRVVAEYKQHQRQGWGVIAQNLGIKPGSEQFHALKSGRLPERGKGGKGRK